MAEKKPPAEIADLLQEDRSFPPPAEFRAKANINDPAIYERAEQDPEAFWAAFASELEWFTKWSTVVEWKPPHAKWFIGGTINARPTVRAARFAAPESRTSAHRCY